MRALCPLLLSTTLITTASLQRRNHRRSRVKKRAPEQTAALNTKAIGTIQVLYYSDCPHFLQTKWDIERILSDGGLSADVQSVDLQRAPEIKKEMPFAGSPTVLVNGKDIAPAGDQFTGPARGNCRLYDYKGEVYDYPPKELIREALTRESRRKMEP
ncbi:MAG: DF family (seleno)protein [Halobacteriota archaeon]